MNKKKLPKAIQPAAAAKQPRQNPGDMAEAMMENEAASADADEMSPESRRAIAVKLVERFALWSGAAGLIPVPFVDLATVGGMQIQMLRRLSQIYEVPFSKNQGKSIIASLAGSMIPATSALGTASLMKGVPVFGSLISAIAMPALSAGATYAIGMAFLEHFASGGTLLDFSASEYRDFMKTQKEMWSNRSKAGPSS